MICSEALEYYDLTDRPANNNNKSYSVFIILRMKRKSSQEIVRPLLSRLLLY